MLEGALRFQMPGAVLTWLGIALPLTIERIARWTPGSGLGPIVELGGGLVGGLVLGGVAGALGNAVAAQARRADEEYRRERARARFLAVLTVAGRRLATHDAAQVSNTAVDAAIALGFDAATLVLIERPAAAAHHVLHRRRSVDLRHLPAMVAHTPPGEFVISPEGTRLAVLANHGTRTMVLACETGPPASSGEDEETVETARRRDEALGLLAGQLRTAFELLARERWVSAQRRRLHHRATHDEATGLLNRTGLSESLAEMSRRCEPAGSEPTKSQSLVAAFIRLDTPPLDRHDFAVVLSEDTVEITAGAEPSISRTPPAVTASPLGSGTTDPLDELISMVSRRLLERSPEGLVARVDEDEIAVVLDATGRTGPGEPTEHLVRSVETVVAGHVAAFGLTGSIGTLLLEAGQEDAWMLQRRRLQMSPFGTDGSGEASTEPSRRTSRV
ncbi:MAG: GGDEF domain-containing protein [Microthrixaceae bacterium]